MPREVAGAGVELLVLQERRRVVHVQLRKATRYIVSKAPVGSDVAAVEKSARGEAIDAGANRNETPR